MPRFRDPDEPRRHRRAYVRLTPGLCAVWHPILDALSASQLDEHLHAQTSGAHTGTTRTGHGDLIDIAELLHLATEAQLIPVVLNDAGGVLSYGQRRRLASCGQRLALAARDRGCSFPACTRPPSWCQAHHVIPWQHGGPTDLANLCPSAPTTTANSNAAAGTSK